ncbi:MAG: phasin family protein [Hyphomicrobiales bacterium]|nr:phasin family protein [Hyphomicrobiales bacterium]MBV9051908.1 phasin family protein [Hyphomicrobiales bacterium]MBV9591450.1 phasin family protein [Hyphomicrobiales bacterium]MBV9975023.1 phasin family protein [Hyphomicrobiales bacterium]
MEPKYSTEAMSQGVRNAAETTLEKAREAVTRYMKEATKVFSAVESTAQATQAGARDVTQKAVNYAETNIAAAFEFARQLLHARDPQEFLKLQQSFVQKQAESLGAQVREMGTTVAGAASRAASRATSEATSEAKTKPAAHDSSTTRSHAASSHSVRSRGSRSRASKAGGSKSRSKK